METSNINETQRVIYIIINEIVYSCLESYYVSDKAEKPAFFLGV